MNERIEVTYVGTNPAGEEARFLDPRTGFLYDHKGGQCNSGFEPCTGSTSLWRSGGYVVQAVNTGAPDLKFDAGKPRWTLLTLGFAKSLASVVAVLTFGAKKYAAHSWRGVKNGEERYYDALYRHLDALAQGEKVDPESGISHWSHVVFNALALHELEIQNGK